MREPTVKQKWAVNLIIDYSGGKYNFPNRDFESYRQFISDHAEDYAQAKEKNKYWKAEFRSIREEKLRQHKRQHENRNFWEGVDYGDADDFWGGAHLYY